MEVLKNVADDKRSPEQVDADTVVAVQLAAQKEGYKVAKHTVTFDHERGERRLALNLVRDTSGQGELELKEPAPPGAGADKEE